MRFCRLLNKIRSGNAPLPTNKHHYPRIPRFTYPLPSILSQATPRNPIIFVKLSVGGHPSMDTKLRWLSVVKRTFQLQRELAEVMMAGVTSRFVYIYRKREDIIDRVKSGISCLCLSLLWTQPRGLV